MLAKSLVPNYLDGISFSGAEASTLKRLGEYQGRQELFRQQAPEVLASLKQSAIIESAESSNRLEGVTALLAMLASCASGLTVVGIDNGYGAACAVLRLLR